MLNWLLPCSFKLDARPLNLAQARQLPAMLGDRRKPAGKGEAAFLDRAGALSEYVSRHHSCTGKSLPCSSCTVWCKGPWGTYLAAK